MHLHILGICGTFMAGIAILAKQQGHHVTGSDVNSYPPMNSQLAAHGIEILIGYEPEHLQPQPDWVIVGNTMKRGHEVIEYLLNQQIPYCSGPEWLAREVLQQRWVLAVAGTHGKTTTSSLLAWILDYAGLAPGFLIGGIPENFGVSARLGESPFFVIEADEYDSAFFDKRSKFIHYHPRTLILNNLEFDHADIFNDLAAIQQQFHHLLRTVPSEGLIIYPATDSNILTVLQQGCWTPTQSFGFNTGDWQAHSIQAAGNQFELVHQQHILGNVAWPLLGNHNVSNGLAAIAAAQHVGVLPQHAIAAMGQFKNVKRRMELKGVVNTISLYDDFAHHPTAIATTLNGLRAKIGQDRMIAILELGSYTMRTGYHKEQLAEALEAADEVILMRPAADWDISQVANDISHSKVCNDIQQLLETLTALLKPHDHIIVMSNTGFVKVHQELLDLLARFKCTI